MTLINDRAPAGKRRRGVVAAAAVLPATPAYAGGVTRNAADGDVGFDICRIDAGDIPFSCEG